MSSVAESGKGPRRRNRAERAALQQEQELLEQQMAKRSFRCFACSTFHPALRVACCPLALKVTPYHCVSSCAEGYTSAFAPLWTLCHLPIALLYIESKYRLCLLLHHTTISVQQARFSCVCHLTCTIVSWLQVDHAMEDSSGTCGNRLCLCSVHHLL